VLMGRPRGPSGPSNCQNRSIMVAIKPSKRCFQGYNEVTWGVNAASVFEWERTLAALPNATSKLMARDTTLLSLNPDGQTLLAYELALRKSGFEIVSVEAAMEARFEIEMGRCGIFLTSYITPAPIYHDLASLFRRFCPHGLVIFLARSAEDKVPDADILICARDEPNFLLERLRQMQRKKAS
jgi:hypothetical protein